MSKKLTHVHHLGAEASYGLGASEPIPRRLGKQVAETSGFVIGFVGFAGTDRPGPFASLLVLMRARLRPRATIEYSASTTRRNASDVLPQSTMSTRNGKSACVKAARKSAIRATVSGLSVISARSRSEVSRAFQATREPKARTSRAGTCSRRMRRIVAKSAGRMSIGVTGCASEVLAGETARRAGTRRSPTPSLQLGRRRRCGRSCSAAPGNGRTAGPRE